jgi:transcriptional regulator with XRE-family HTH domain
VQNPSDFVRGQVTTVRGVVDQVASSVAETVAAERSKVSATGSQVGEFIREQRNAARVSLRELARTAGVSNPYLSQVERGLRKPSAEILMQIAKALKISAETLYVRAGILEEREDDEGVVAAVLRDHHLGEEQKQALLRVYRSFLHENDDGRGGALADAG